MAAGQPTILATSGGYKPGSRTRIEFDSVMHYAVELAGVTGRAPRVTHIGTASGDQRWWAAEMDQAARIAGFDFSHLNLFTMPNVEDPEAHLLEQDVVWVNGGSVVNLLAVWRAHGLDRHLRKAWENGVVLAGVSAGSICWFKGGVTDSFGPELKPVTNSLGFLPFHNGVHFDSAAPPALGPQAGGQWNARGDALYGRRRWAGLSRHRTDGGGLLRQEQGGLPGHRGRRRER